MFVNSIPNPLAYWYLASLNIRYWAKIFTAVMKCS